MSISIHILLYRSSIIFSQRIQFLNSLTFHSLLTKQLLLSSGFVLITVSHFLQQRLLSLSLFCWSLTQLFTNVYDVSHFPTMSCRMFRQRALVFLTCFLCCKLPSFRFLFVCFNFISLYQHFYCVIYTHRLIFVRLQLVGFMMRSSHDHEQMKSNQKGIYLLESPNNKWMGWMNE